jgi:serine protease Do
MRFLVIVLLSIYSSYSFAEDRCKCSFADTVEPLMPAVVNIYTVKYNKAQGNIRQEIFPGFPLEQLNDLFSQLQVPFGLEEMYSNPKAVSLGSGFIVDAEGYIVTNNHVINNADEIHVKLIDNTELPAKLIGTDPKTDLALLKIESKNPLSFVKFGDSKKARIGDWIIVIGNPFGLGGTVTTGIISSKGRDIAIERSGVVDDFIQTDAAINSGNSGGPMFNTDGEVIGVNTAIYSPSGANVGIGFAIPSSSAHNIIEQLKKFGKISRGRLDVKIQEVTPEIAEGLGLKEPIGALVVDVLPGGAADKAGVKSGDIIIEFAGTEIKNSRKLQVLVAETQVNTKVKIVVIRDGKKIDLSTQIFEVANDESVKIDSSNLNKGSKISSAIFEISGITFSNVTDELRTKFDIKSKVGVVVSDVAKSSGLLGLKLGDIVLAGNQQPVSSVTQLSKVYEIAKSMNKKNIVLLIQRKKDAIFVAIPIVTNK